MNYLLLFVLIIIFILIFLFLLYKTKLPKEDVLCPPNAFGNVPYPNDCRQYIMCMYGTYVLLTCPDNFYFSAETLTCLPEDQVDCGSRPREKDWRGCCDKLFLVSTRTRNEMDVLQNGRVRIDKNHACRRVIIEPPNLVSFTFDRLATCVQINTIEISGLRQSYECFGQMVGDMI